MSVFSGSKLPRTCTIFDTGPSRVAIFVNRWRYPVSSALAVMSGVAYDEPLAAAALASVYVESWLAD